MMMENNRLILLLLFSLNLYISASADRLEYSLQEMKDLFYQYVEQGKVATSTSQMDVLRINSMGMSDDRALIIDSCNLLKRAGKIEMLPSEYLYNYEDDGPKLYWRYFR